MSRRNTFRVITSLAIAAAWYVLTGVLLLAMDTDKSPGWLESAYRFMSFPVRYLPGWESWDSRNATMSFKAWGWYSNIGELANCLLWGFSLVWLYAAARSLVSMKREATNS